MRALLLILPLIGAGCVAGRGGQRVVFDEEIRLPVSFESPSASTAFHSGLRLADREDYQDSGGFFVLLIAAGGGTKFHETQFYNAQVRIADADRDDVITQAEADHYREWVESQGL